MNRFPILVVGLALTNGASADPFQYAIDDGHWENQAGLTGGGYIIWLNQFNTNPSASLITSVEVCWGWPIPSGTPATLALWDDPNGDGNPGDAVVLHSQAVVSGINDGSFSLGTQSIYDIPDTFVGESFFVGIGMDHNPGQYPASLDYSPSHQQSWIAGLGSTIENISGGTYGLTDDLVVPGNWLIRANAIPAPATLGLLVLGLVRSRRR